MFVSAQNLSNFSFLSCHKSLKFWVQSNNFFILKICSNNKPILNSSHYICITLYVVIADTQRQLEIYIIIRIFLFQSVVLGLIADNPTLANNDPKYSGILGMISHKKSLITIFGHKHKIKNFIKKFDIFH